MVTDYVMSETERNKVLTPAEAIFVDGFDETTKTVYEFHGCFHYGCIKCFPNNRHRKHNCHPDRTILEIYEATQRKTRMLQQAGYRVIEMWECEFLKAKETEDTLQEFLQSFELVSPLNSRDEAFFGGRTNAVCHHAKTEDSKSIKYIDINSLYPFVNKIKTYPVGHPKIFTHPADQNIAHYFGIAKVKLLPPGNLYHPVLPVRANSKLTFPLCGQCVKEELEKPWLERSEVCSHTKEERAMIGTWCSPELHKAVEQGYEILKIYEVWHFPEDQPKEGLFAEYVNKWLKNKTEATGWPKNCVTAEQKAEYVRLYEEREGVQLDPNKFEKNSGRKQVAKLMLNR